MYDNENEETENITENKKIVELTSRYKVDSKVSYSFK